MKWWYMPAFILATGLGALTGGYIAYLIKRKM